MDQFALRNPLASLRLKLQAIDAELAGGELPPEALADLKSAVDDVRLRVWAALSAADSTDGHGLLLRFRLRRAIEICTNVTNDLEEELLGAHQRELLQLRERAQVLVTRIDRQVRGG
jgi:hypothetical protein